MYHDMNMKPEQSGEAWATHYLGTVLWELRTCENLVEAREPGPLDSPPATRVG